MHGKFCNLKKCWLTVYYTTVFFLPSLLQEASRFRIALIGDGERALEKNKIHLYHISRQGILKIWILFHVFGLKNTYAVVYKTHFAMEKYSHERRQVVECARVLNFLDVSTWYWPHGYIVTDESHRRNRTYSDVGLNLSNELQKIAIDSYIFIMGNGDRVK